MSRPDRSSAPYPPKFGGVVLVCRDCQQRSSGPSKLTAKDVRKELKRGLLRTAVRHRVVESGCLGLCPRKAIVVVVAGSAGPVTAVDVRVLDDVESVVRACSGFEPARDQGLSTNA